MWFGKHLQMVLVVYGQRSISISKTRLRNLA
jgi:hypothetical protein